MCNYPFTVLSNLNCLIFLDEYVTEAIYQELYNLGTSEALTTEKHVHAHMTSSSEDMQRLHLRELAMIQEILQRITKGDLEKQLER